MVGSLGSNARRSLRLCVAAGLLVVVGIGLAGCPPPQPSSSIEGDWAGYWWYEGVEGDTYIEWSFYGDQFECFIPDAPYSASGTFSVDDSAYPATIDLTIEESSVPGWEVGTTFYGYYEVDGDTMYRSVLEETRPTWSPSLLDPDTGTVFVATQMW